MVVVGKIRVSKKIKIHWNLPQRAMNTVFVPNLMVICSNSCWHTSFSTKGQASVDSAIPVKICMLHLSLWLSSIIKLFLLLLSQWWLPSESRHNLLFVILLRQQVILNFIPFELKHLPAALNWQKKRGGRRRREGSKAKQVAREREAGEEMRGEMREDRQRREKKERDWARGV